MMRITRTFCILITAHFWLRGYRTSMGKSVAYIRASTDKQDLLHQKLAIYEFARKQNFPIETFLEFTISSRKTAQQRRIDEMLTVPAADDMLIVTELSP